LFAGGRGFLRYSLNRMELIIKDKKLRTAAELLVKDIAHAGGRAFFVGGCVRDSLLKIAVKDIDVEVYGISLSALEKIIKKRFKLDLSGKPFAVLKIKNFPIDISLPRTETKIGAGHRDFRVSPSPALSIKSAAKRRDFTINAILLNDGKICDPFGGAGDLKNKILRHVSPKFSEDPLRVLRGMQFCARFGLSAHKDTLKLCNIMTPKNLAQERLWPEWEKLLLLGSEPSKGLNFLKQSSWLKYYPQLNALSQSDWQATLRALNIFAQEKTGNAENDLPAGLAVSCARLKNPQEFLEQISPDEKINNRALLILRHIAAVKNFYRHKVSDGAMRRLALKIAPASLADLARAANAINGGKFPPSAWLIKKAQKLGIADCPPKPILSGKHLIALGAKPGPQLGKLLAQCFAAQLDGKFSSLKGAIAFAKKIINNY
ncbi:MAG: hypothetical protein NTW04_05520, partial [Elusimicrobia bacterium]|nr:hypothetical protein [Elusimicrobiota bacterium]